MPEDGKCHVNNIKQSMKGQTCPGEGARQSRLCRGNGIWQICRADLSQPHSYVGKKPSGKQNSQGKKRENRKEAQLAGVKRGWLGGQRGVTRVGRRYRRWDPIHLHISHASLRGWYPVSPP